MWDHVIQIGAVKDVLDIIGPTNAIIIFGFYIIYQVYSPEALPDTKFQKIIARFRGQVTSMEDEMVRRLDEFGEKQLAHIQITRAIASVENPAEEIDADVVDQYLLQNGINKDDFFKSREHRSKDPVVKDDSVKNSESSHSSADRNGNRFDSDSEK